MGHYVANVCTIWTATKKILKKINNGDFRSSFGIAVSKKALLIMT